LLILELKVIKKYYALGKQPVRIPPTGKFTIEIVKPLHGTMTLFGHHGMVGGGLGKKKKKDH